MHPIQSRYRRLLPSSLLVISLGCAQSLEYPPAQRTDQIDEYHGVDVADPYQWMEDLESPDLHSWMRAQDDLLDEYLSEVPSRESLARHLYELTEFDIYSAPIKTDSGHFYTTTGNAGVGETRVFMQELDGEERLLIDPDERLEAGDNLGGIMPSPDGGYLTYSYGEGQSRWRDVRVLEVATGADMPETLTGLNALAGAVSWTAEGTGFYYVRYDEPEAGQTQESRPENPRVMFHRVGTPQAEDQLVFERPEQPNLLFTPTATEDGRYLVLTVRRGASQDVTILYWDVNGGESFRQLVQGPHTFLGNEGESFFFYSTLDAPNGRVVAVDLSDPSRIDELVSERDEAITGNSLVGGNGVGYYGGRFVLLYTKDALPIVRVFDSRGELSYEVDLPDVGTIWGGFAGQADQAELFYRFLSLTDAAVVYRMNLETGENTVFRAPDLAFDSDDFVTKQVFYQSKDGTRIPMFVVHRQDLALDGRHPLFMYGYGAYAWTAFLWYQPHIVAWLEMGGVYALPGIRGGGEYGREWHQAGVGRNRQNAIDDYNAAATWLIENGYTSPGRLIANGGSASGSLAGAAVVQRPNLYGASVIDIPTFDMLRRGGWEEEFGDPSDPDDFEVLYGYSPYHNMEAGVCYPAMLVMAGEKDETAVPFHAYKFVARMQRLQACDNPVLLKVMWGAGHTHGATPRDQAQTWADAWSFLIRALDLDLEPVW